ncbi:MAG: hypothetical protein F6K09_04960 [Merismopedia sp. SIO2A8]|nr:hypothetical protein [Merismopedia sp. SIO2A8]
MAFPNPQRTSASPLSASSLSASSPSTGKFLLILLHGWGANAKDVATMAPYLLPPEYPDTLSMLFPDAPFPHPMPGGFMWYNLPENYTFGHSPQGAIQEDLLQSRARLMDWLQGLESQTGIPLSRTILAGFSQGGAMTADVGTRLPLAGLMILSGYLHDHLQPSSTDLPPILQVHGRQDLVVPLVAAQQLRDRLTTLGAQVIYHELDMGHDIPLTVLELMQSFIQNILQSGEKGTTEVL